MKRITYVWMQVSMMAFAAAACSVEDNSSSFVASNHGLQTLPQDVYSLRTIDPTDAGPIDDLLPISDMVGDAKVVGLGESIHTSGGFHDAKSRIIHYLVEKKGFRVFALETPRITAQPVADYIASCTGSPDTAVRYIFGVFASTTMRDLFKWMCEFNQQHASDPIQFIGFDMQEPLYQMRSVAKYLNTYVPQDSVGLITKLKICRGTEVPTGANPPPISNSDLLKCHSGIDDNLLYLKMHQQSLIQVSSLQAFSLTQLSLKNMAASEDKQYFESNSMPMNLSFEARDKEMAATLISLRELLFAEKKAIIWAHNFHLEKAESRDSAYGMSIKNMGEYLSESWGADYAPIGFLSYQTEINWPIPTLPSCRSIPTPTAQNSVEKILQALNEKYLFVNLNSMTQAAEALFNKNDVYRYGSGDTYTGASSAHVNDEFNGLVFLENSSAMTYAVSGASCPPTVVAADR